ncbi:MAG: hypothetical protein FWD69_08065 [Polyangiaceae bacterium]|nr:hypothetical protein [Polyangiaceae bacterium]
MKRIATFVFAFVIAAGRHAYAVEPSPNSEAADTLFYEARALMKSGRYAEACPKLEESLKIDGGIGTRYNLADCNEHIGKLATAYRGFSEVVVFARAADQREREELATKRAHDLEPRLPRLIIDAGSTVPEVEIRRDGETVGPQSLGTPVAVDPGTHTITASAPGRQTWAETVNAVEGATVRVTLPRDLPSTQTAAIAAPDVPPSLTPTMPVVPPRATAAAPITPTRAPVGRTTLTSAPPPDFPSPVVEHGTSAQRVAGYTVLGLGVVGLGVGGAFGLRSLSKHNDAKDHCVNDQCDADGVRLRKQALDAGNVATFTAMGGAVALVSGFVLIITAPSRTDSEPSTATRDAPTTASVLRAAPVIGPMGGGVLVEGVLP